MTSKIAIDYENYLISEEAPIPKPICISYFNGKDKGIIVGKEDMEKFLSNLLDSDQTIIAHNATFECLVTHQHFPQFKSKLQQRLREGTIVCTQIIEQLLDNIRKKRLMKYSLADLVKQYFDKDISESKKNPDAWRLRYHELDGIPLEQWPQEAIDYAINDSIWAYKCYELQQQAIKVNPRLTLEASYFLNLMGKYGLMIDLSRVEELETDLLTKVNPGYEKLLKAGFVEVTKKGKYKKNMNRFREHIKGLGVSIEKTPKGTISTSKESLTRYLGASNDPIISEYLNIMDYEKVLTAFVHRLKQAKPLIRTDYNAVVSSGRTSSRSSNAYPSVNIQQMPRGVKDVKWDVRNCFVPRPGYKIVSIDYSGLELASTASQLYNVYGKSQMFDILNGNADPVDMHSQLAARIMTIKTGKYVSYDDFMVNYKHTDEGKFFRQLSKPINLGFPGGIGYETMRSLLIRDGIETKLRILTQVSEDPTISVKKAREAGLNVRCQRIEYSKWAILEDELVALKRALFKLYPDLEEFLTDTHNKYLTGEFKSVKNEFGEWEQEPMYAFETKGFRRDWCTYTEFCNGFLMQSPSAVGAKTAMINIIKKYQDSNYIRPLAFIHDEIVFEVLDCKHMEILIEDVAQIMIDAMQKILGPVRIAVEADAMDYWMKSGGFYSRQYWKNGGNNQLHVL